jgi:hypothetical protein
LFVSLWTEIMTKYEISMDTPIMATIALYESTGRLR